MYACNGVCLPFICTAYVLLEVLGRDKFKYSVFLSTRSWLSHFIFRMWAASCYPVLCSMTLEKCDCPGNKGTVLWAQSHEEMLEQKIKYLHLFLWLLGQWLFNLVQCRRDPNVGVYLRETWNSAAPKKINTYSVLIFTKPFFHWHWLTLFVKNIPPNTFFLLICQCFYLPVC